MTTTTEAPIPFGSEPNVDDDMADVCPDCDASGRGPLCRNHKEP